MWNVGSLRVSLRSPCTWLMYTCATSLMAFTLFATLTSHGLNNPCFLFLHNFLAANQTICTFSYIWKLFYSATIFSAEYRRVPHSKKVQNNNEYQLEYSEIFSIGIVTTLLFDKYKLMTLAPMCNLLWCKYRHQQVIDNLIRIFLV